MKIMMMTNTYTPHVGGVARSVASFAEAYRQKGHRTLVVAPAYESSPPHETDVVRIPAIQRFNGSDFSVALPLPGYLHSTVESFRPEIIHAHHPFLLGDTALRLVKFYQLPLVFTHHTMYEQYTHYVPFNSKVLKKFVIQLSTSYANLCDLVFAPSASIAELLRQRGVTTPIEVVPTGVDPAQFSHGASAAFRSSLNIPPDAFVVGHIGRLAPEKNLAFLAQAVASFIKSRPDAHFLVSGTGSSEKDIRQIFAESQTANRLHITGTLSHPLLSAAYRAMNVFAFASTSETQGIVLTEAMAAGVPVIAVDAPGVREIVTDRVNGRLLPDLSPDAFSAALHSFALLPEEQLALMKNAALQTAAAFSMERTAAQSLAHYEQLKHRTFAASAHEDGDWQALQRLIKAEWTLLKNMVRAADAALLDGQRHDLSS